MDETDEMIKVLGETVLELKKGITEYSNSLASLNPDSQAQAQEYIKEMHHIALKLNQGIEALHQLKELKARLMGGSP